VSILAEAFTAALGETFGRGVFAMGLSGGALVATIVVCLTAAWAIGEVTGVRHSLEQTDQIDPEATTRSPAARITANAA
jgi:hypothetical protein